MKYLLIIILLGVVLFAGCDEKKVQYCENDSECVPLPTECHTTSCINSQFAEHKPMACSEIFRLDAAYTPDDCICVNNMCTNKNLGRTQLPEEPVTAKKPANVHIVGGDKDEHGCIGSAGYTWCDAKDKCLRTWEEECPGMTITVAECEQAGGDPVNRCEPDEKNIGDVTGFISQTVCCVPTEKDCTPGYAWDDAVKKCLPEATCRDLCGDHECESIVCMGSGCPCAESPQSCPQDCS